jgi:hypothetical protein
VPLSASTQLFGSLQLAPLLPTHVYVAILARLLFTSLTETVLALIVTLC